MHTMYPIVPADEITIILSSTSIIILLDPDNDDHTYVTSHLVDTSFKLISDFCHVNQGVLCCEHAEQASSSGVLGGGGGGGGGQQAC